MEPRGLKRKSPFKRGNTRLKTYTPLKQSTLLKARQKTAKKLPGGYQSIFGPLDVCAITGARKRGLPGGGWSVVPHHIFGGAYKAKSETYGFILPLRTDWHTGHIYSIHEDPVLDLKYKYMCQEYYIHSLGKTKEDFIREFGKWYV